MFIKERFWPYAVLFAFSGSSGLVYQVVWVRKLQYTFGVTAFAVASVLAAFFFGLALGSAWGGRISDRLRSPLLAYGIVEIVIGMSALLITPFLDRLDLALRTVSTVFDGNFWTLQAARFLITLSVLLIPTTLLGVTVPLMSRGLVSTVSNIGSRMAVLYAANTFGAVIGVIVSGFYLIERVGLNATVWVAGGVSIIVGIIAIRLQQHMPQYAMVRKTVKSVPTETTNPSTVHGSVLLLVMGISGAMGLGLEVVWTRILIQTQGASAYIFCTVLAIFLIGIALGSYVVKYRIDRWSNIVAKLAFCEAGIGLMTIVGIPVLFLVMPLLTKMLFIALGLDIYQYSFAAWILWCIGALLPVTVLLGATFPLAVRILSNDVKYVGMNVGKLYAANTFGGVVGVLVIGFILIPQLGIHRSVLVIAGIQAVLAIVLMVVWRAREARAILGYLMIPLSLMVAASIFFSAAMVRSIMTRGLHGSPVLAYEEDYYGTLVVSQEKRRDTPYKRLWVNGVSYSSSSPEALHYMRLQGHIPMIMYPGEPKRALVICFGAGITAGSVSTYTGVKLTVAEISRAVVNHGQMFSDVNENITDQKDIRIVIEDGRNFLLRNVSEVFDVVTLEPPPPIQAGVANLYTKEFYQLVRERLTANGVAAQWIPLHTQNEDYTKILIATFVDVFPNASLWWTEAGDALIVGRVNNEPLPQGHLNKLFANAETMKSLSQIGIHNEIEFSANFLLDSDGLRRYVEDAPVMSDDHPVVEYQVPKLNRQYKTTLRHMFIERPPLSTVISYLGLDQLHADELRKAMKSIENERMQRTVVPPLPY